MKEFECLQWEETCEGAATTTLLCTQAFADLHFTKLHGFTCQPERGRCVCAVQGEIAGPCVCAYVWIEEGGASGLGFS